MVETAAALEYMDQWRDEVLCKRALTPIITALLDTCGPAAGVGAHLANDILYLLAIYPMMPAFYLCSEDTLYHAFRDFMPDFMSQWISEAFKKRCGVTPNSINPFEFNYTSNTNFIARHVLVYRREEVRIPRDLFNKYQSLGLFDDNHIIGEAEPLFPIVVTNTCRGTLSQTLGAAEGSVQSCSRDT